MLNRHNTPTQWNKRKPWLGSVNKQESMHRWAPKQENVKVQGKSRTNWWYLQLSDEKEIFKVTFSTKLGSDIFHKRCTVLYIFWYSERKSFIKCQQIVKDFFFSNKMFCTSSIHLSIQSVHFTLLFKNLVNLYFINASFGSK